MARRGTLKYRSVDQENFIARKYNGSRSPSSGANHRDRGDVRTESHLIECKLTGTHERPSKSISLKLEDFEKIADEAYSEGKYCAMALRIYNPDSPLSDAQGNIDFITYLVREDFSD